MATTAEIRRLIEKRRRELEAFDKLSKAEQQRRTVEGLNPYEPKAVRDRKRAAALERRKREFDKLPKEVRDAFTAMGASPYQVGQVIRRTCGNITTI